MELACKPDWAQARKRMEAWWEGELLDRVCIRITAPIKQDSRPQPPPVPPEELESWWMDPALVIPRLEADLARIWWGGEAFPVMHPVSTRIPAIPAVYLGCPLSFVGTSTAWCSEIIHDWAHPPELRFDETNKWYRKSVELFRAAGERAHGKYCLGGPDLNGPGEILARLRGSQNLALDLVDNPATVREAMGNINLVWMEYWHAINNVINEYVQGCVGWMGLWSDLPAVELECDFSIMISNDMFRDFFLPHIRRQTEWVARSVYHLDGPGAVRHLDSLLELPRLTAIQWVPGAGAAPMTEWIPLLKRIQDAGKRIFIDCRDHEVEPLLTQLRPEGLLLSTRSVSVERGKEILKLAEKMTSRR